MYSGRKQKGGSWKVTPGTFSPWRALGKDVRSQKLSTPKQIGSKPRTKTKIAARKLDNFYVLIWRAAILLLGIHVKKRRKWVTKLQKKYQQRRKNGKKRGWELILSTMTSRQKWRVLSKMYIALDVKPVYLRTKAAYHCYLRNTLTRYR